MKHLIFLLLLLTFFSPDTLAQINKSGKVGIGYSGNFTGQTNELGISIWLARHITIEPQIGLRNLTINEQSGTNWRPGIGILLRINDNDLSPYIGLRGKWSILAAKGDYGLDETYTDFSGSLVFGGDYFFTEWISVGAEMKVNYISSDENFSPNYPANASIFETEQIINFRIYLR
jgi:hypothetical protein